MTIEELKSHIKDNVVFYGNKDHWDEDEIVSILLPPPANYSSGSDYATYPELGSLRVKERRGNRLLVIVHLALLCKIFNMEQ
jgi:hypothetical protein